MFWDRRKTWRRISVLVQSRKKQRVCVLEKRLGDGEGFVFWCRLDN